MGRGGGGVVTVIVTLIGQRIGDLNLRIGDLNLRIEQTNRLVDVNREAIETNRRAIETNRRAIETNREAIETNREAIETVGRRTDERFDALQALILEALEARAPEEEPTGKPASS